MLLAAWPSRRALFVPLRCRYFNRLFQSVSEDARQEIVQRLLKEKPVVHLDVLIHKKTEQLSAAIGESLPSGHGSLPWIKGHSHTFLPPGRHLLYFNTIVPTEQLLPDGTDVKYWPGQPFTTRLWAGGRIRFPQRSGLDFGLRKVALVEYVRDVRVVGLEGEEKIFVKIERRVGAPLDQGKGKPEAYSDALSLESRSKDIIGSSFLVETRDLCFMRETGPTMPFKRRHIATPGGPDFSHSLTPSPALLFRYSALTFNAHAIHIDPEYTRKVYGFPNLLVHGPLALTLMLEYMRQILHSLAGSGPVPVITEINYRNLAPLFANEEMTICVKKKRRMPAPTSPTESIAESNLKNMRDITKPHPIDDASENMQDRDHSLVSRDLPASTATKSAIDTGTDFAGSPVGKDAPSAAAQEHHTGTTFRPAATTGNSPPHSASDASEFPQEWEIWIQTGRGDETSLAVRGNIKVEHVCVVKHGHEYGLQSWKAEKMIRKR